MTEHFCAVAFKQGIDIHHVDRRLMELRALGLPYNTIAKVVGFYEGWPLSGEQVRYRVRQLGAPKDRSRVRVSA